MIVENTGATTVENGDAGTIGEQGGGTGRVRYSATSARRRYTRLHSRRRGVSRWSSIRLRSRHLSHPPSRRLHARVGSIYPGHRAAEAAGVAWSNSREA
jgi:hypothetical protein